MALLERLQILVDGNASGAIREFQKVGAAADRELGRTEDKLLKISNQLTSFGTGLLAGSAVAAVGLSKLATAASDYGEAVNKATVILGGESVKQLEDFAGAASKTAGISKTAALDAAAGFGALGKQAGLTGDPLAKFSTDLVQLAGDLASFNNTTVDESLQALKSGLQGETEPLKRFNIFLNDTALKAEYAAITGEKLTGTLTNQQRIVAAQSLIFKQASDATGDFERTSDSLANQQRTLQADLENLKTEIGQGLLPVFQTVVGAVGGVVGAFGQLSPAAQDTIGKLAGFGVIGAGGLGALSVIAGQALKLRDALTVVGEDGTRGLTKVGRAAVITGKIFTALAASEAIFAGINAGTDSAGKFETALNRVRVASEGSGAALGETFAGAVKAQDDVLEFQNVWTDFGARVVLTADGTKGSIEDVQQTFNALAQSDPDIASGVLDDLQRVTDGLDRNSDQYRTNQEFIDSNREALQLQGEAAKVSGGELDNLAGQFENLDPVVEETTFKVEGLTIKTQEATDAFKAYADALRANTDPFFAVVDAAGALGDAEAKVAETFKALFTDGATTQEIIDFANAQRDAVGAGIGLESAIANLRSEVELGNIEYGTAIETLDLLQQKYPQLAGPIGQVKDEFFFAALAAQGLKNEAPIDLPITSNVQPVLDGLSRLSGGLFTIKSNADLAAESVVNLFGGIFNSQNKPKQQMPNLPFNAYIPPQFRRAQGGPVLSGQSYLVGEQGPEMFVPRTSGTIVPNGGTMGNVQQTFNITTGDPILTAAEVVRRQRDAEFLAGV
jgi:hypothetical protein